MSTRSKGSLLWKILISLALLAVVVLIVAELGLRWYISESMKKQLAQETSTSAEGAAIKFGPTPLLLSALTHKVPHMDINTPSTLQISEGMAPTVTGNPPSQLEITDLDIADQNNPVASHLVVHTQLPEKFLLAKIQQSMAEQPKSDNLASQLVSSLVKVTDVQANGEKGVVEVVFTDGAAKLSLRPSAADGKVQFQAEDAQLLGMKLPRQATDAITKQLEQQASEAGGNLRIDKFDVVPDNLDITFSGDNVPLNEAQPQR